MYVSSKHINYMHKEIIHVKNKPVYPERCYLKVEEVEKRDREHISEREKHKSSLKRIIQSGCLISRTKNAFCFI